MDRDTLEDLKVNYETNRANFSCQPAIQAFENPFAKAQAFIKDVIEKTDTGG